MPRAQVVPPTPAAVEVAAYWITQEALTNVKRHAHALTCNFLLAVEPSALRLEIADDHPLFRGGLRALLESIADTEVVGEAATGEEAVDAARALVPDVVVMDINMPGLNGIDATRRIVDESDQVNVLVMTMHDDDDAVFAAIRAGARGYQLKGAAQDETLRAIRSVANQVADRAEAGLVAHAAGLGERPLRVE